ncbi:NAD-dependent epimerase/dehydratase family protein [Chondromyces crocatus]|uniref:NDP-sugar oxidoreductase n=1 Tax=Chondromyces crocatus TaxID=52 RepID=A0A0K1E8D3_CHOCO|nr:NAD(P)-dependent oxidoreductase [Chondromyces crocatus]AKT37131.1 NDP-sugar oxidoreductase [Chondromyces crocatus]
MTRAPRSALVTGATGFIGSALCRRLVAEGVRTVALVRAESAVERLAGLDVTVVRTDTFERDALRAALRGVDEVEAVFHLAAYGVHPDQRDAGRMIEGNIAFVAGLLSALEGRPMQRFLFAGTCSEYGPVAEPERLTESSPVAPRSIYGAAKAAASLFGAALARTLALPFVTLRLFGVYGPGEGEHRLVPYLVRCLQRGETPTLTGGEQVRDLTFVDDVVEALVTAAVTPALAPYEAYNLCGGRPARIRDVAEGVARALGRPDADLGLGRRPYREDEPMWLVGDGERFMSATGWRPEVDLDEGLRRTVAALSGVAPAGGG